MTQTAICNTRHTLHERLARWLLEAHDRLARPELRLSHEFLALMLGSRRAGVTVALGAFRQNAVIATERSHVRILDRKRLEKAACECYRVVSKEYRSLLS